MSNINELSGTMHAFMTIGTRIERGGYIANATSKFMICDLCAALAGHTVQYADGATTRITIGLAIIANQKLAQYAYIGNAIDNGHIITVSPECEGTADPDTWNVVIEEQMKRESEAI